MKHGRIRQYRNIPIGFDKSIANWRNLISSKVVEVWQTPNGSYANWLSIGKYQTRLNNVVSLNLFDRLLDEPTQFGCWEHHAYPNNFSYPGYKFHREFEGKYGSASAKTWWDIYLPDFFFLDGWQIAIVYKKSAVQSAKIIVLDDDPNSKTDSPV